MIGLAILAAAALEVPPKIVFRARFYSANPKVKTQDCIYISDIDGKNRKKVFEPKVAGFVGRPWFVGKNRIIWAFTRQMPAPKRSDVSEVWTYTLSNGKSKLVRSVQLEKGDLFEDGLIRRAIAVKGGAFATIDPATGQWRATTDPKLDANVAYPRDNRVVLTEPKLGFWALEVSPSKGPTEGPPLIAINGDLRSPLSPEGNWFTQIVKSKEDFQTYVESIFAEHETHHIVYRFNWATGILETLLKESSSYDFQPGRRWCSWTDFRAVKPLGSDGTGVWTHNLFIGDFQTRKDWKLFTNEVKDITAASIQPTS